MDFLDAAIEKNSINKWELTECETIYDGRYSSCVKNGLSVRKYYRYDNPQRFIEEYKTVKSVYEAGILVPKPIVFAYEEQSKRWFIESELVHFDKLQGKLGYSMFKRLVVLTENMQSVQYRNESNWSNLLEEFERALGLYEKYKKNSCDSYINKLKTLSADCFIHGDFSPKNLGISFDNVVVFDFQNSGNGPMDWDIWYFLSDYDPDLLDTEIYSFINEEWVEFICIILRIRIGRALRKDESVAGYESRLEKWEDFIWNRRS